MVITLVLCGNISQANVVIFIIMYELPDKWNFYGYSIVICTLKI